MAHADGDTAKAFLQEVKRGAEPIFVLFSEINEPMSFKKNVTSGAYYQCTVRKASYHSAGRAQEKVRIFLAFSTRMISCVSSDLMTR